MGALALPVTAAISTTNSLRYTARHFGGSIVTLAIIICSEIDKITNEQCSSPEAR